MKKLNVNEIFVSIDGEVNRYGQGGLTTFIRFSGCNLDCSYCDTKYAQGEFAGKQMTIMEIINQVKTPKVTITGGEPLYQKLIVLDLILELIFQTHKVTVETNGSLTIPFELMAHVNHSLGWVIDYKLEYAHEMKERNFYQAGVSDWIKLVIDKNQDYDPAISVIKRIHRTNPKPKIAIGFTRQVDPVEIINRLTKDEIWYVYLNFQIHKFIGLK